MKKKIILGSILFSICTLAIAQTALPPALYIKADDINSALEKSAGERENMAVGTINNGDDYRINLIRRTAAAGAIVHEVGAELHFITEGAGTLLTGGIIVRPADGGRANIEQGLARRVTVGDAIIIPEGTPHQYTAVEGAIGYLEVRF
ncbi:MAG: hypothetical protein P8N94_01850 [Gammaproteobacteria bacterium]|nr:hypothetical protein [Gammaproteobacteria bacterium]MDG2336717.1 hypothetical protein [Gammaproteobacteria bacterium]